MKILAILILCVSTILTVPTFTQETNSTTQIEFETPNNTAIPVFEVMSQSSGFGSVYHSGESGFVSTQETSLRPALMAPTMATVSNGWHRYQIGTSTLFRTQFDVAADGSAQTWVLDPGSPALNITGWAIYGIGIGALTSVVVDWLMWYPNFPEDRLFDTGTVIGMTIGGSAATIGGLVLGLTTDPSATRIR